MDKNSKTDKIRNIPIGGCLVMPFEHPAECNNWKTLVSYCNTTYGKDDNKRYSFRKNTKDASFAVRATSLLHSNKLLKS